MRTPFFPKKKFSSMGQVRVGYGLGMGEAESSQKRRRFPAKIFDSQSLSLPSSLYRHSHILSLPATMHSELRFGLATTENQLGAPFSGFLLSLRLPFLFIGHHSLSLLGLKAEAPFSLCLSFQAQTAYFSLSSRFIATTLLICGYDFPQAFHSHPHSRKY